jgi:hypothetical protein
MATKIYTVHERGGLEGDVVFVREGFNPWAFIFTFFWLWLHRAWMAGILVLLLSLSIGAAETFIEGASIVTAVAQLVLSMGVGIFGNDLRRAAMERRGYKETGVAGGGSVEEAELRYFGDRSAERGLPDPESLPIPA